MRKENFTGYPSIDMPHTIDSKFAEKHPIIPSVDTITILKLLSRNTRDLTAINCDELTATYQDLINDSHIVCNAFRELGVKKGDIVTISLPSNYQAIVSFLALNELGAITTFIDMFSTKEDIYEYLNEYSSPIFINYNATKEENDSIIKNTHVKNVITLKNGLENSKDINGDYHQNNSDTFIDFHTLGSIAEYQKNGIYLPNSGKDDSLILYTSGSTGKSKSVVLTNKNVLAAQMYAGNTSHTENITGMKTMTCVPLRYPYGMVTSLLTSLLWGKEAIMTPNWSKKNLKYYLDKNPNIIFGAPSILDFFMKYCPDEYDLSKVSHFISGGDFLTVEKANKAYSFFEKHNNDSIEIGNGCGNAETVSIGSTPVGVPLKQSTAGKILVGSTPLVIDPDIHVDKPIEHPELLKEKKYNEIGELCLAGDHVFKGYYNNEELTKCSKFTRNGKTFFRTGTLGFIDEDGYFTPTGRKSRFYITGSNYKVYLDKVQNTIIKTDERILDAAAVSLPDDENLYAHKVFIVLDNNIEGTDELKEELMEEIKNSNLKQYEYPIDIEFVSELPRIYGSDKIDYHSLEDWAINGLPKQLKLN